MAQGRSAHSSSLPVLSESLRLKIAEAHTLLDQAIKAYRPSHAFPLFSGRYDSLVTTHLAVKYLKKTYPHLVVKIAHLNTGIGIEQTRQFVCETCQRFAWPLVEYR